MRINKYVASATSLSRRAADEAIAAGQVLVNGLTPSSGQDISASDHVLLNGHPITPAAEIMTIIFNKPPGYVVSRNGQGALTIYDLLPPELHYLKPIGRLDKDSSGLLLLTNDGHLAQELTHPSRQKRKVYEVRLDKQLQPLHRQLISDKGIMLDDGMSRLQLERKHDGHDTDWIISMHEGRNRQIRRTFGSLGYQVTNLHRTQFGDYQLGSLHTGKFSPVNKVII